MPCPVQRVQYKSRRAHTHSQSEWGLRERQLHGTQLQLVTKKSPNQDHNKSIMTPPTRQHISYLPPKAPTAIYSIMPTDFSHSHLFNHGWQIAVASHTAAACRAHNFSSSKPSTSFTTKPPCRPTLRPPLAGRYPTAAFQLHSPARIAAALF